MSVFWVPAFWVPVFCVGAIGSSDAALALSLKSASALSAADFSALTSNWVVVIVGFLGAVTDGPVEFFDPGLVGWQAESAIPRTASHKKYRVKYMSLVRARCQGR